MDCEWAISCGESNSEQRLTAGPGLGSLLGMSVKSIQLGQVWRNDQTSQNYLVTKVYSEVFSQYAMLRVADATAASTDTVRVKVQKTAEGATLPGYTFTQESQDF